ncbi:hypothetical protein CBL_21302, partial [Carabus blaptoides fortunei]
WRYERFVGGCLYQFATAVDSRSSGHNKEYYVLSVPQFSVDDGKLSLGSHMTMFKLDYLRRIRFDSPATHPRFQRGELKLVFLIGAFRIVASRPTNYISRILLLVDVRAGWTR